MIGLPHTIASRPILIPSTRLGSDKYQLLCHCFEWTRFRTHEAWIPQSPKTGEDLQLIWPSRLVYQDFMFEIRGMGGEI